MSKFNLQNELLDRARLAKQLEDYLGAEKLVKRAIALTRQEGGPEEHTITRYLTRELAGIHVKAGSLKKAENAWKSHLKSLRQIKKNTETEQLEISKTMVQMALFYQSQDLARQAKIRYGQALKIQEPLFSKENPDYVLTLSEYARILCREGKRRKAESLFLEALKLAENILGDWDEYVALVLRRRALAFKGLVNPELLEPYLERAVAILADDSASPHPELSKSLAELADLSLERGYVRRAEKLYVKSYQLSEGVLGSKHKDSVSILTRLARLRRSLRKYEEAESHFRKILTVARQVGNSRSLKVARALRDLGSLLVEKRDYEKAEPFLLEALDIQQSILGRDHVDLARTLIELASLHKSQNNFNLAEVEYKRALKIRGNAPMAVADTLTGLALLHQARKQHAPAEKLLLQALSIKEEAFGPEAPQLVETLNKLGIVYENLLEVDRAIEFYERANVIEIQQHGFYCRLWLDPDESNKT
ncbi:MAG: tetratricopeptide repeat protein [Candidatus Obscuribacterales bacterium]|nr:tetratricopeptide repeat protein [Candidatus Obscuribacterales bacterium]